MPYKKLYANVTLGFSTVLFLYARGNLCYKRNPTWLLTKPDDHKDEDNTEYYRAIGEDPVAAIVKVLDRCNNVSSMMLSFETPRVAEYIAETEQYTLPLMEKIKKDYPQYNDAVFVLKYQIMSILETIKAAMLRL